MFNKLVPEYDRFNRLSSLGLDNYWRREAVRLFESESYVLDVGTGTGDLSQELLKSGHRVVGVDFSERMVQRAKQKFGENEKAEFQVASADRLPFESRTFDGLTSSFVIRNLHQGGILVPSLREFARVLKPGGLMVHLELTAPPSGWLQLGYQAYVRTILPSIGRMVFGDRWPQDYLRKTIENFPMPKTMCQWIRWAGFERICHYPLNGGIASLFVGTRC